VFLSSNAKRLDQRARRIESLFGQSVSTDVLEALKKHPDRIARTELREVSVLFCDLRDFTAMTSTMSPVDVAEMLNEYFNHITPAVFEHDGFIDKFVGDEVMAVFSVPFDQGDHVERAVRTAIDIKQRLATLNRLRQARDQPMLNCGLGIHCGPAAAGHIGSQRRSNYTVVGTTVNLAARIEHFTSSGEILVSEAVRAVLPARIAVRPWKRVEIRGAEGDHMLFEVLTDNPV
jgi:adenylate cyclase